MLEKWQRMTMLFFRKPLTLLQSNLKMDGSHGQIHNSHPPHHKLQRTLNRNIVTKEHWTETLWLSLLCSKAMATFSPHKRNGDFLSPFCNALPQFDCQGSEFPPVEEPTCDPYSPAYMMLYFRPWICMAQSVLLLMQILWRDSKNLIIC